MAEETFENPSPNPAVDGNTPAAYNQDENVPGTHNATTASEIRPTDELDPVEEVPAEDRKLKGTPHAGLQRIRAGIKLLETHSAAKAPGSLIGEALVLLEDGYSVLSEHHPDEA